MRTGAAAPKAFPSGEGGTALAVTEEAFPVSRSGCNPPQRGGPFATGRICQAPDTIPQPQQRLTLLLPPIIAVSRSLSARE